MDLKTSNFYVSPELSYMLIIFGMNLSISLEVYRPNCDFVSMICMIQIILTNFDSLVFLLRVLTSPNTLLPSHHNRYYRHTDRPTEASVKNISFSKL